MSSEVGSLSASPQSESPAPELKHSRDELPDSPPPLSPRSPRAGTVLQPDAAAPPPPALGPFSRAAVGVSQQRQLHGQPQQQGPQRLVGRKRRHHEQDDLPVPEVPMEENGEIKEQSGAEAGQEEEASPQQARQRQRRENAPIEIIDIEDLSDSSESDEEDNDDHNDVQIIGSRPLTPPPDQDVIRANSNHFRDDRLNRISRQSQVGEPGAGVQAAGSAANNNAAASYFSQLSVSSAGPEEIFEDKDVAPEVSSNVARLELECGICQETIEDLATTTCGHVYCYQCLSMAVRRQGKCPTCRKPVNRSQFHRLYL